MKIAPLGTYPVPHGSVRMKGTAHAFRLRVGNYRVVYEIHYKQGIVMIDKINKRSRVYD